MSTTTTETRAAGPTASGPPQRTGLLSRLRSSLQQMLAFVSLIVLFIFFTVANPDFASVSNISGILLATAVIGIFALGTTFVIITGGIDLSIGTGMTLCSVMVGVFLTYWGLPLWVGVLGGIAFGALIGLVNGSVISFLGIPPFIATLAMMMVAQGLALVISGTKPIYFTETPGFFNVAMGRSIPGLVIPNAVIIMFIAAIIAWVLLSRTVFGRYTFSIGSNAEATALSGINVRRWQVIVYTVAGCFTGLAGVIMASRLSSAQPGQGMGYELEAIAAVIIGGTSLQGGKGSIIGTVIRALIMSVLTNGLQIMSIPQEWQKVVVGVVILIAVFVDMVRRKRQEST